MRNTVHADEKDYRYKPYRRDNRRNVSDHLSDFFYFYRVEKFCKRLDRAFLMGFILFAAARCKPGQKVYYKDKQQQNHARRDKRAELQIARVTHFHNDVCG